MFKSKRKLAGHKPKQGSPLGIYKKVRVFLNMQGQYKALLCLAELEAGKRAVTEMFTACQRPMGSPYFPASFEAGQGHESCSSQLTE